MIVLIGIILPTPFPLFCLRYHLCFTSKRATLESSASISFDICSGDAVGLLFHPGSCGDISTHV